MKKRILFVEDDATFRRVLEGELRGFGYEVLGCASAEEALKAVAAQSFDLGLFDLRLPEINGIELMRGVQAELPTLPVVFLTGHGAMADAVRAMREGAFDFLVKPAPLDELELTLQRALEHARLKRENQVLRHLVDESATREILGESPAIVELRGAITRVAASDANLLIYGENGTGKELIARAVHEASPRREASFVAVNCGAIPSELFESELFGHRKGAFTGADADRPGLVELAEGGTLFLDEIGELPLALQPVMLRFAQFGEFRAVGSTRTETADVRLVAATNRDLSRADRREFREDLYHRISTLGLVAPPLRDRGTDIALLARAFLARANARLPEDQQRHFASDALAALQGHRWSGNIRELENLIVRLVTLSDRETLDASQIAHHLRPIGEPDADPAGEILDLQALERRAVVAAMKLHSGRRERAAAELGVAVKTLYNKLRHHAIAPAEWGASPDAG